LQGDFAPVSAFSNSKLSSFIDFVSFQPSSLCKLEQSVSKSSWCHRSSACQYSFSFRFSALEDAVVPLSKPITGKDGKKITELYIPKDTNVILSLINSNRNPDIWGPDALDWKPERWLSPLPKEIIDAHIPGIYSHMYVSNESGSEKGEADFALYRMTFGAGTRSCM
jgi:hypothetical protein